MAAFYGEHSGDFLLSDDALDIMRTGCKLNLVGMPIQHTLHGIPEVQCAPDCLRPAVVCRDPKREKRSVYAAFPQAGDVDHSIWKPIREIDVFVNDVLNCVVVSVNAENVVLDAAGLAIHVL